MSNPTKRIGTWVAKTTVSKVVGDLTSHIVEQKQNAAYVSNQLVGMESQVRQTLNASGVPTIQYPFYLNFGRELWALLRRGHAGESLAMEASVLLAKWTAQGLTQAVLQAIRTDVFNISAPIAP